MAAIAKRFPAPGGCAHGLPRMTLPLARFMNTVAAAAPIHMADDDDDDQVATVSFNQDHGCFALAHRQGFVVYNTHPVELRVHRHFDQPVAMVAMLHRTNYLAVVGQDPPPATGQGIPKLVIHSHRVTIWDDLKRKPLLILDFDEPVKQVILSRVRIVVVLPRSVKVYAFLVPPKPLAAYDTSDNGHGLCDLLVASQQPVVAFPARQPGQVHLVDVLGEKSQCNRIIKAHKAPLRCLALKRLGTLVATASYTGTLIRVHLSQTGALVYEFRRGLDKAEVTLMKFSHNDKRLAVLSNKGTLHIFALELLVNRQHLLKRVLVPLPMPNYFNLTWLACCVTIEGAVGDEGTVGWLGDLVVIIWKRRRVWEQYAMVKEPGSQWFGDDVRWSVERIAWKRLTW